MATQAVAAGSRGVRGPVYTKPLSREVTVASWWRPGHLHHIKHLPNQGIGPHRTYTHVATFEYIYTTSTGKGTQTYINIINLLASLFGGSVLT